MIKDDYELDYPGSLHFIKCYSLFSTFFGKIILQELKTLACI